MAFVSAPGRRTTTHRRSGRSGDKGGVELHAAGERRHGITDPDAIGPDGTVRLRCYLPLENSLWFFAGCQGRKGCGHVAPIGVRAALRIMGTGEATVGEFGQRLRCSRCGNRQIIVTVQPDTRTAEAIERDGPAPETRAGLTD